MHLELTAFQDWLTCQYPHSSARKHIISDLALFFSWVGEPPSEITLQDVDGFAVWNPHIVQLPSITPASEKTSQ